MIIIPIVENIKVDGFQSEKGLSLYIEFQDKKIIFDTGRSDIFIKNALKLGININDIDFFIVSHGHNDHFGGINYLPSEIKESSSIYVSKESMDNFDFNFYGKKKSIGRYKESKIKGTEFESVLKLSENMFLIKTEKKEKSKNFFKNEELDNFNHEIHLIIIENNKVNIITGCCHSGVLNLLETVKKIFPNKKINSLIGGLHTRSYIIKPLKLIRLIFNLRESNISKLILGHCTGQKTIQIIKIFLNNVSKIKVGNIYNV